MRAWRVAIVFIAILLCSMVIVAQLAYLQIFQFKFYRALAQGQQNLYQSEKGERGEIFFKDGKILATNIKGKYVFAIPAKIKDESEKERTAKELSKILHLDELKVLDQFKKDSFFERIKIAITSEEENQLKSANLAEVYVSPQEEFFRSYPQKEIASQLVGFLGGEGVGQYGVEGYYDDILAGKERFSSPFAFRDANENASINGADIFLTIDYNIQTEAENLLKKAKENLDIESGQIIVENPITGEILALVNFPGFDPNQYYEAKDFDIFQNAAISKLYEPGSIFKPVTMAAALDKGKITPQTTYIDNGRVDVGHLTIYNFAEKSYGQQTMTQVLEKSINTGAVFAERQVGNEAFMEYVEKFGFFKPTGIDLSNEVSSQNKELKKGYEINYCTAAFGQGIEATPMQVLKAFSVIANGGRVIKPHIVGKVTEDGKIKEIKPEISREKIISEKTASELTAMLTSAIENGFSKKAQVPGYYLAGKTGTAQVSYSSLGINKKGYSDKTWQSFVGFGPAYQPKFLIMIKLDNPKTKTAEYSALPIFRELAQYMIDYLEIPPDHE